jgi:peptide/nickel transport system permease protein
MVRGNLLETMGEDYINIPGLGSLVVEAANRGDLPLVLGITVLASFLVSFTSLAVDVIYGILDPRVRYS